MEEDRKEREGETRRYTLGHSNHDDGELKLSNMLLNRAMKLPKKFDLKEKAPKIRDQKNQGACASFSLCYAREMLLNNSDELLSPAFLYYQSRNDYNGDINNDFGITIKSGLETLVNWGVCEESYMPYNDKIHNVAPSEKAIDNAKKYKVNTYINIDNGIKGIKNWLVMKEEPVVFGMTVFNEFNYVSKSGILSVPKKNAEPIGNHAAIILGYIDNSKKDNIRALLNKKYSKYGYFICANSFGSSQWGNEGFFLLPYEYILQQLTYDFYVITV